jgi:ATP-binding cassette subfamily B protein
MEKRPGKGVAVARVLAQLRPVRKLCVAVILLTIMVGGVGAVMPLLRKQLVDLVLGGPGPGVLRSLVTTVIFMVVLEFAMEGLQFLATILSSRLRQGLTLGLFNGALTKLFRNDLAAQQNEKTGGLLHRLHYGVFGFTEAAFDAAVHLLPGICFMIGAVGLMLSLDWRLSLITISLACLPVVFSYIAARVLALSEAETMERWQKAYGRLYEGLSLFKIIKALCIEDAERHRYIDQLKAIQRISRISERQESFYNGAKRLTSFLASVLVYGYGGYRVIQGELTLGTVVAFAAYTEAMFAPMLGLAGTYEKFRKATVHLQGIFKVLDTEPKVLDAQDAVTPAGVQGRLAFEQVCFSYNGDRPPVLNNVSFVINPNETVALVGRSGSGKTTVADLLCRFHDPNSGRVTVDGVDLRQLPQAWWRRQIGLVLQDNLLFEGTIWENIACSRPGATEAEIIRAAQIAHAAEFIDALPDRYQTHLGEMGAKLSAGERQRIAIARAMLSDPPILIFDEASSNLDARSERIINRTMRELRQGRTMIVIAHRKSTIKTADVVLMVQDGQIVERGRYADLLAQRGHFFDLMREMED